MELGQQHNDHCYVIFTGLVCWIRRVEDGFLYVEVEGGASGVIDCRAVRWSEYCASAHAAIQAYYYVADRPDTRH